MSHPRIRVRLLFADEGAFHTQDLHVPASVVEDYERIIDGLREDPGVLKSVYLDLNRLAAAWVADDED